MDAKNAAFELPAVLKFNGQVTTSSIFDDRSNYRAGVWQLPGGAGDVWPRGAAPMGPSCPSKLKARALQKYDIGIGTSGLLAWLSRQLRKKFWSILARFNCEQSWHRIGYAMWKLVSGSCFKLNLFIFSIPPPIIWSASGTQSREARAYPLYLEGDQRLYRGTRSALRKFWRSLKLKPQNGPKYTMIFSNLAPHVFLRLKHTILLYPKSLAPRDRT